MKFRGTYKSHSDVDFQLDFFLPDWAIETQWEEAFQMAQRWIGPSTPIGYNKFDQVPYFKHLMKLEIVE